MMEIRRMRPGNVAWKRCLIWALAALIFMLASDGVRAQEQAAQAEPVATGDPSFVAPDAAWELLANGAELGMVLVGDADMGCDGVLYFSDITFSNSEQSFNESGTRLAGTVRQLDLETGEMRIFRSPSGMANGIAFDSRCNLVLAEGADLGGRRITRTDMQTGRAEIVAGFFEEEPLNAPNDVAIDEQGRIYFTDTRYLGHEVVRQESNGVYRVDPDGHVERIVSNLSHPNGIALSPDQSTLYVSNYTNRGVNDALVAYDLHADGQVTFREVLVAYPGWGADGFTVDSEGNLWVAVPDRERPGIYAYTPQGVEKAYIQLNRPWNTSFGRDERRHVLYVTASNSVFQIVVEKQGYHLPLDEEQP